MGRQKMRMRIVTIHLPEHMIKYIDTLVENGWFPNRSEFIRFAISYMSLKMVEATHIRNTMMVGDR